MGDASTRAARAIQVQVQARALGDPTRNAIFQHIAAADHPVDVAELTDRLGLNHNAIRQHLAKLLAAGLVEEGKAASGGRGRPRLTYRASPAVDSRWGVTGPYERLSILLAEALRSGETPAGIGRKYVLTGLDGLRREEHVADPVGLVADVMARQGFDPAVRRRGRRVEIVLRTCPFESAALANPDSVCGIHLGIAQGLGELTAGEVVVDELIVHDPRVGNCLLRLHLEAPDAR